MTENTPSPYDLSAIHKAAKQRRMSAQPSAPAVSAEPISGFDEAINEFWKWAEENAIDGAHRVDDNWRVDEIATYYAAHREQLVRDECAQIAESFNTVMDHVTDGIAAAIRSTH